MQSTPNPNQTDPDDVLVIAPDIVLVARADRAEKEFSNLAHDAVSRPSDSQTHMAPDFSAGPSVLPVDTTFRAAAVNDVQIRGERRAIGGRAIRACIGFLLAVCIAPQDNPGLPEQPGPPAIQASAANAAAAQPVPPALTAPEGVAPASATLSPESTQLLQSMAGDLAHAEQEIEQLKASIAQLKASQQQMSRDFAKASGARASEQNLRSRLSAAVQRSATASARKPMPPLPSPQAAAPSAPRQGEPQPQATAQPQAELTPRPPMPLR
jgi:hypothetical protein